MTKRLEMIEQMIANGSRDPFVHYARAMELRSLGRLEESLEAYEKVAKEFPEYVPTYLIAGQVAEELERQDLARRYYDAGLERAAAAGDTKALGELQDARAALD